MCHLTHGFADVRKHSFVESYSRLSLREKMANNYVGFYVISCLDGEA
jgi:hypothetical protein